MKTITIKFNNQSVELIPNTNGLYPINELYKVSGAEVTKKPSQFYRGAKLHLALNNNEIEVIHGNNGGTWVTELGAYKYAAWISPEFETAVFESFKAAVNGDAELAVQIAQSVVGIREELKDNYKEFTSKVEAATEEGTIRGKANHACINLSALACKAAFGLSPSQYEKEHGIRPRDHMLQNLDLVNMTRYKKLMDQIEILVDIGMSYDQIKAALNI